MIRSLHMYKKCGWLIVLTATQFILCQQSAVTYLDPSQWGGRLGDKLMMYVKAKWVAHVCDLPFYYKPFAYTDQLMMHTVEQHLTPDIKRSYSATAPLEIVNSTLNQLIQKNEKKLYTIHYYFALPQWGSYQQSYDSQEIMAWPHVMTNLGFLNALKKTIKPRNPIQLTFPPANMLSVAVHIRKGGGFDHPLLSQQLYSKNALNSEEKSPPGTFSDKYWPLKFPPLQYYVDQIIRLSEMHNDTNMYVYIFTDDQNPDPIKMKIKQAVNKQNITFDCRSHENHRDSNVLEDLFSMTHYDCLIRSGSNYPQIAQLIGNHKITIYPIALDWIGNTMVITKVGTFIRDELNCENHVDVLNEYGDY